ncbi:MAG: CoA transferase [Proteobacteria bacterium]|nr:CoA transferase [Pseudomonadota bacterium]
MSRPLEDVVVIDLTSLFCASLSAAFLADFGARVIRVDSLAPTVRTAQGWNYQADLTHRNKESIALDLNGDRGVSVLRELIAKADVVVTDWSAAELKALAIDYERACALRPDIVFGRLSGFGPVGPDCELPAIDELAAARTGIMPILPQPGQPPVFTGAGAMHSSAMLAFGVVTALLHRADSGEGQAVDVSLFGANMYGAALDIQAFLAIGKGDRLLNPISRLDVSNPMSGALYPSADGRWVTLTMPDTDRWWPIFSTAVGLAEDDPRFDTHDKRTEMNRIELIHALEAAFATQPGAHWRQVFLEKQMSADVIERFDFPASDPQALANRYILELEHPSFGAVKSLGFPIFLSEGTARLDALAPCIGQHSSQILRDLLGYSEDAVHACRRAGVVA